MESRIESDQKVIERQSIKLFDKLQSLIIQWNPEESLTKKVIERQSIKLFDKLQSLIIQWNPEESLTKR